MKVLFVGTELRLGGREKVLSAVAEGLHNDGVDTEIFSVWKRTPFFTTNVPIYFDVDSTFRGEETVITNPAGHVNKKSIPKAVKSVGFWGARTFFKYSTLQYNRVSALIRTIVAHNITTVVLTDLTITFAKRIRQEVPNIKIVGWVHMEPAAFFDSQYASFKHELITGFSYLDEIITLTHAQNEGYKKYLKSSVRVTTVHNPMPAAKYLEFNDKAVNNTNKLTIVSRIDINHKGFDLLFEALQQIEGDWNLDIIGSGNDLDVEWVETMIKELGFNDKVRLLGPMKGQKLNDVYADGGIFLMSSRYEGFPMTLGEAMSAGLPIVAFALDGVIEATGHDAAVLVDPYDTKLFASRVTDLLQNATLRKLLSEQGIKRVKTYSMSSIVQSWESIIR